MPNTAKPNLHPVNSALNRQQLMHLLRRCLFGISYSESNHFSGKSAEECLRILLTPSLPVKMLPQEDPDVVDPLVPHGADWTIAPYENEVIDKRRRIYLKSWWVGRLITRDLSLTEKMTLFWHNHLATEIDPVGDARYSYRYAALLRKHALGNAKALVREITTNPAMLMYLNGNTNMKGAPNENYSRELLELFTIGKHGKEGYTEEDVRVAARVLTGWKADPETITVNFNETLHDSADKQFSAFFNNHVIKGREGKAGAEETDELIDLIFGKRETAMFICRNIYRWFVSSHITNETEAEIIAPLADVFIQSGYEISPVLQTLLSSEHFFDNACHGCIVKSPVDFFVGVSHQLNLQFPEAKSDYHLCWIHYNYYLGGLSQFIGDPPSVAGWPAYYQPPKFHQWWINSYTLGFRKKIIESLASAEGMSCNGPVVRFNFTAFVEQFKQVENAETLVNDTLSFLLAVDVNESIKQQLFWLLAGKENEATWTSIWQSYLAESEDKIVAAKVEERLKRYFVKIFNLPEFQMI